MMFDRNAQTPGNTALSLVVNAWNHVDMIDHTVFIIRVKQRVEDALDVGLVELAVHTRQTEGRHIDRCSGRSIESHFLF